MTASGDRLGCVCGAGWAVSVGWPGCLCGASWTVCGRPDCAATRPAAPVQPPLCGRESPFWVNGGCAARGVVGLFHRARRFVHTLGDRAGEGFLGAGGAWLYLRRVQRQGPAPRGGDERRLQIELCGWKASPKHVGGRWGADTTCVSTTALRSIKQTPNNPGRETP